MRVCLVGPLAIWVGLCYPLVTLMEAPMDKHF